ncbi:MAG: glutamate formimidoyltransferase [Bacteroidales bacterium]|jgi:glutamate formiminotransferase/formiminotetrahydrofolate cyclodeaminase|nr:glutamate formimidoyltransferase [Bacteroidales bacterium]
MKQIIECVPNISEGRNMELVNTVANVVQTVEGVKLLDIDPGATTNRSVITFVGEPKAVCEAAFLLVKKAQELIDMRTHHGDHPRFGATDVCPLIPVANITMDEVAVYAKQLGERIGKELSIPVYCYENAAFVEKRRNLAACREGEYEGLANKITSAEWKPDFGPSQWNEQIAKSGAIAVGARDFLLAVNYNLNTTSTRRANAIAFDVREKGRPGQPGTLKGTKAIGWFIKEYGIAQVSMNITNINLSPLHICFDEVSKKAAERGIRVTGTEVVGLMPKKVLIDAGKYYLAKQQRSLGVDEAELIKIAVKSMGLDDLKPFNAEEKVIEYLLKDNQTKLLADMTCNAFVNETASESAAPGGGSVSAFVGSLGAALATMVANLSSHKKGWDERWEEFSKVAEQGQIIKDELLYLIDEDTKAFNLIMEAFSLPKATEDDKKRRAEAIEEATKYAIEVPYRTLCKSFEVFELCHLMIEHGNPNSVTDAAVGVLCAKTACVGAFMNMQINAASLNDRNFAEEIINKGAALVAQAEELEKEYTNLVLTRISK